MTRLAEYITAAFILSLRAQHPDELPQTWEDLSAIVNARVGYGVEQSPLRAGVELAREWGLAEIYEDQYAGDSLDFRSLHKTDYIIKVQSSVLDQAFRGGYGWLQRVFSNPAFWIDLDRQVDGLSAKAIQDSEAPASDRVVTFSDNQVDDLERQTTEVIDAVAGRNQIGDDPGLREILLGQLRAGRELIRVGSVKLFVLQVTLIDALSYLSRRYEKEAIGALASALLSVLLKQIGLDN
ncbi:hypothetical protein [Sphingomonas sp.]|uniref:hypothetical protein n=1 Tax=Sphingomonas sp. TaxID=28214 RepID=UPI0035C79268